MIVPVNRHHRMRKGTGATLTEFAAAISVFFCFIFVPFVDIAFVPARYMLVYSALDKVVHRMALCEKRSQAVQYLRSPSWRADVERWGVSIKDAKVALLVCDNTGNTKQTLVDNEDVPRAMLPGGSRDANNELDAKVYSMEITTVVDIPPLYSSKVGLPGFSRPITFSFRNRAQWENLSPDPLTSTDPQSVKYYINE